MIIPSFGRLVLATNAGRQVAWEIVTRLFDFWRWEADRESIPSPGWGDAECPDVVRQYLDRIRNRVVDAEGDDDPNRLTRLNESLRQCLAEANNRLSTLGEDLSRVFSRLSSNLETMSNPFLVCRTLRQAASDLALQQSDAQHRLDESRARTQAARVRYEGQRSRAQAIESGRNASQSVTSAKSSVAIFVAPAVISLLGGVIAALVLNRFFGGTLTGWLAGLIVAISIFVVFLRKRGNEIADVGGWQQVNIFPEDFKNALHEFASAQMAEYVAEREVRIWEDRRQGWVAFAAQRGLTDLAMRLDAIGASVQREQTDEPSGFFDEPMPGEIQLRGRALTRLIVDNLEARSGREQLLNAAISSLSAASITPQHLASALVADTVEEVVNAAGRVIGDLKFSTVLSMVFENSQGSVAANSWLKRFRDEVLAPAQLHEGVSRDSRVRETLKCGLPGGAADPLAHEIKRRLDCEIQDSTIANGLELLCISRNIRLNDLRSTHDLRTAYEGLPEEVREILFNFPSRAEVDPQPVVSSVEDAPHTPLEVLSDRRTHENGRVSHPSFRRRLGHPFRKRAS